jgi:heme exporter protein D
LSAITEYLAMGGYGVFVWAAYAVGVTVLGGLTIASLHTLRARERAVAELEKTMPRRRRGVASAAAEASHET